MSIYLWAKIAVGVVIFAACFTVWALCRAAARGDKVLAEAFERSREKRS